MPSVSKFHKYHIHVILVINVWIGQEAYTEKILRNFEMDEAKSIHTPVDASTKLVQAGEEDSLIDQSLYQLAVGSLMYLSTATRPDIPYTVNNDAMFCARPTGQHIALFYVTCC